MSLPFSCSYSNSVSASSLTCLFHRSGVHVSDAFQSLNHPGEQLCSTVDQFTTFKKVKVFQKLKNQKKQTSTYNSTVSFSKTHWRFPGISKPRDANCCRYWLRRSGGEVRTSHRSQETGGGWRGGANLSPIVMVRVNQQRAQWSVRYCMCWLKRDYLGSVTMVTRDQLC